MSADFEPHPPVLILHGLDGSGPGHWQRWLAARLEQRGLDVRFPDLPRPGDPTPADWMRALDRELAQGSSEKVTICHSLGCLLWLRAAAAAERRLADRVLLVAPPWRDDIAGVARFLDHGAGPEDVDRAAESTRIVCSDNDPYCPPGPLEAFARPLGIHADVVQGAGHINTDAGFGPWPAVEAWAMGEPIADWART